jgi:hypothetical protein
MTLRGAGLEPLPVCKTGGMAEHSENAMVCSIRTTPLHH